MSSVDPYSTSLSGMSDVYTSNADSSALSSKISSTDYANATDEELMDACKEFESYLVEQVFKSLEKMVPKDEDEESNSTASAYTDMFGDTLTQEYASLAAESNAGQGLGIAQMLYEQMKRNYDV